jgi:SAM-dependent methyltransferase
MAQQDKVGDFISKDEAERLLFIYASVKKEIRGDQPLSVSVIDIPRIAIRAIGCFARVGCQHDWATSFRLAYWAVRDSLVRNTRLLFPIRYPYSRLRLTFGLRPMSYLWGLDRGVPIHRHYVEEFLQEFSSDIRGHSLEFQEDSYMSRFGGDRVTKKDILHKEYDNPNATIVADLTKRNHISSEQFDCIICTYVLNIICDVDNVVSELYRMLKPGGVLLVAVPQASMSATYWHDLWRWTAEGFHLQLARFFGEANITVRAYGNSLTAAGDIRGLVTDEFTRAQLDYHDPRFGIVVCARAVKRTAAENAKSQATAV